MPNVYLCFLLAGLCILASCHHVPGHQGGHDGHEHPQDDQQPAESHEDHSACHKIARSGVEFATKVYRLIASESAGKNVFFSPVSMAAALMLVARGAKGITREQIVSGLGFNQSEITTKEFDEGFRHLLQLLNTPDPQFELSIGNALFTTEKFPLRQEVLDEARDFLQANIVPANFDHLEEAKTQINSYIEEKTHGKLVDVIGSLDPETVMVIINYILMKAHWEKPFDPQSTRKRDFFINNETTVQVDMMHRDGQYETYHDKELGCEVVRIPYKGDLAVLFILPKRGKLDQVEQALSLELLAKWKNSLKLGRIELLLPKVSLRTSYNLKETFRGLGITEVFTDQADLSAFTGQPNLKVSQAIHKAYLNIHENGTEAAAVTVIEMVPTSLPPWVEFNSPYLVVIGERKSKSVLFLGRVMNPNEH
ncbi:alpha-1-antiproteinase F-like [Sphaerodactylus townsendi]|uniref:Uncharacterized protein n=1 Tax=Sphaerodactylus townsendi TaxID=933632 RepID=A0ACB8G5L1_9SAUR|nr:alpha-1-antiproteinase F-like [Sphaerodactylus townsendi]